MTRGMEMRHLKRFLTLLGLTAPALTACQGDFSPAEPPVIQLTADPSFPGTLAHSDSVRLAVRITNGSDQALTGVGVRWQVSDSSILLIKQDTVPPSGALYGLEDAGLHATVYARNTGQVDLSVSVIGGAGATEVPVFQSTIIVNERWIAVSAGTSHTCAISVDSTAFCFGGFGALGTRSVAPSTPVVVAGLERRKIVAVDAGDQFSCGKAVEGLLYCWGANVHGEMGNGTLLPQFTADIAAGRSTVDLFSVGSHHVCATGYINYEVVCWGEATFGQIGVATFNQTTDCDFLRDFVSNVTWPTRQCYLTPTGPVLDQGIDFITLSSISAGGAHTCALSPDTDELLCWGLNNVGQLGIYSPPTEECLGFVQRWTGYLEVSEFRLPCVTLPWTAAYGSGMVSASPDESYQGHTCTLSRGFETYCWGSNGKGQLGTSHNDPLPCVWDGDSTNTDPSYDVRGSVPCIRSIELDFQPVETSVLFSDVGAGARSTCALGLTDSLAYCWGDNSSGELGDGTSGGSRYQPAPVAGQLKFIALAVGSHHACAITHPDGALYCWGDGTAGQLGSPIPSSSQPVRVGEPVR